MTDYVCSQCGPDERGPIIHQATRHVWPPAADDVTEDEARAWMYGEDQRVTPDEFRDRMKAIAAEPFDNEKAHGDADDLMCEVLRALGYGEGIDIFESMERWYA